MNDATPHEQPLPTLQQEREAARARREARLKDYLKRPRTMESESEWSEFRCGKNDPNRWQVP